MIRCHSCVAYLLFENPARHTFPNNGLQDQDVFLIAM